MQQYRAQRRSSEIRDCDDGVPVPERPPLARVQVAIDECFCERFCNCYCQCNC
uniref:Uncharacterized protein n=1 Tax=Peronospora matthiolae TaxID=2874970 RepID=A0AAV1TUH8_9STRA